MSCHNESRQFVLETGATKSDELLGYCSSLPTSRSTAVDTACPLLGRTHPFCRCRVRPAPRLQRCIFMEGVKLYYKHQVDGTRPNPNGEKAAVVTVKDLEIGEQFKINTEHAVLNVPTEASIAAMVFLYQSVVLWSRFVNY